MGVTPGRKLQHTRYTDSEKLRSLYLHESRLNAQRHVARIYKSLAQVTSLGVRLRCSSCSRQPVPVGLRDADRHC